SSRLARSQMRRNKPGRIYETGYLGEEKSSKMEKDGRGKTDRINPVHHAAVSFDEISVIFDAAVALDRGHDQPAAKAHEADGQRHPRCLPGAERRRAPKGGAQEGGGKDSPDETLPGLVRADVGGDSVFARH